MISREEINFYEEYTQFDYFKEEVTQFCDLTKHSTELICCMVHRYVQEVNHRLYMNVQHSRQSNTDTAFRSGFEIRPSDIKLYDLATSKKFYRMNCNVVHEPLNAYDVLKIMRATLSNKEMIRGDSVNIIDIAVLSGGILRPAVYLNCVIPCSSVKEIKLRDMMRDREHKSETDVAARCTLAEGCNAFVIIEDLTDGANSKVCFKRGTTLAVQRTPSAKHSDVRYTVGLIDGVKAEML